MPDQGEYLERLRRRIALNALNARRWSELADKGSARAARVALVAARRRDEAELELEDALARLASGRPLKCGHLYHGTGATCELDAGHSELEHAGGGATWPG